MMFSDKSKGALEYEMIGPYLREGEVNIRTVWPDMSKTLETTIQQDKASLLMKMVLSGLGMM